MDSRLITCPESAHLELIEYEDTPLGLLVTGCSAFRPPCQVNCPRTCAARFDLRARAARAAHGHSLLSESRQVCIIGRDRS